MKNSLGPPQRRKNNVLVDFYCCDKNHHDQTQLGEERFIFQFILPHHSPSPRDIRTRIKAGQEPDAKAILVFLITCSYGLLSLLFINPGPPVQDGIAHSELSPPISITSRENVVHITFATG